MHLGLNFNPHMFAIPVNCQAVLKADKTQVILHQEKETQEHLRELETSHGLSQATKSKNQLILPVPTRAQ